ncbi:hypothetical protein NHF45_13025 [Maricaulaceae bacterium NA33B04]|nr:hypothetical protein [Maricaulaceae bacterium NA33B04]
MSKSAWGWIAFLLLLPGTYSLVQGFTDPAAISASGNAAADGAVILVLAAGAFWKFLHAKKKEDPDT